MILAALMFNIMVKIIAIIAITATHVIIIRMDLDAMTATTVIHANIVIMINQIKPIL